MKNFFNSTKLSNKKGLRKTLHYQRKYSANCLAIEAWLHQKLSGLKFF